MTRPFDDLDAAGWDHSFEEPEELLARPTLSVSWACIEADKHTANWYEQAASSVPFELDGTQLTPAEVVEFSESSRLYPGFSAQYAVIHRIDGFPVLRVHVSLDGPGSLPEEEVVHTLYCERNGVTHDVQAHVQFVQILSKVCGVVLSEVAKYTILQALASKRKEA